MIILALSSNFVIKLILNDVICDTFQMSIIIFFVLVVCFLNDVKGLEPSKVYKFSCRFIVLRSPLILRQIVLM